MAYDPIAFDPIAYDVTQSAVHVYTKDTSYWIPLKCLVEVYDNTGNTLLLSYDMFHPEANVIKLLECTISLGLTKTQFTLKFEDGYGVINQNTIGLGNKILVYAGRSSDHLTLLFTGYSENRTPTILANNVMDYEMSGYGENAALNDIIVNFKRASSSLTDIEDPNFPKRPDSKMVVYELVKDLFEDTDVRATNDLILKNYLNLDISGISPLVTERLLSIVQSMTEVSQVLNFLTEVTGAYWNIENGKLYFEYPEVKHSGIIIKNKVTPTDLAGSTSYFLGPWTYTDSISKDKGFANRIYTTTATDTKSIANSMSNKGATALFDRAIAVQVTLLETRLTTIALLLSKIGDPFTPLSDEDLIYRGGVPINPPPPPVTCPLGYHLDSSTNQCVPDVIVTPPCPTGYTFNTTTQTCVPDDPVNPPPPTNTCPTDYIWSEAQGRCILDVTVPPPTGDEGEFDDYGIKWMVARGEQFVVEQSRDQATDDRWSGNIIGLRNGLEATFIGRSSGTSGSAHFAYKGMGGNHSGSGAESQRWYDFGIRENGDVQLEWEGPHPNNHSFTLPSSKQFITNIGTSLDGNWIGLKWCFQTVTSNGSPANGGVRCRMWVDTDPINTSTSKPNNNWRLCFDFIDGVDVEVIDPQDYEAPDEQDCEVRRSDTDTHDVYGLGTIVTGSGEGDPGLHVRRLGTPAVPHTCPTGFHWDTNLNQCVANTPTCPTGYHWDANLGVCVADTITPPPPTQSALNISVFSDCDADGSEMVNMLTLMRTKGTHQFIICGDFDHDAYQPSMDAFSDAGLDSFRSNNVIWCRGNHERSNSPADRNIAAFFNTNTTTFCKKTRIQNVFIIGTDTSDTNFDSVGSTQYNYVLAALQEANALRLQGLVQWIIVAGHKPHYAAANVDHPPSEDDTRNAAAVYQPLFNQYGVDFVFNGHNHDFAISQPLTTGGAELYTLSGTAYDFTKPHGQFYINDANVGRNNYNTEMAPHWRYVNSNSHGWVFMSFDTTGLRCKVQCLNPSGNTLHEFDVIKTGTSPPPPPPPPPPTGDSGINQTAALNFIKNSYKSNVQMLEEAPGFNVFWLWNDQLLGQICLKHIDPAMATTVRNKMLSYGIVMRTPWATLDPAFRNNFSIRLATEPTIQTGPPAIRYSDYGGNSDFPINNYADIAFLSAIHQFYMGNLTAARQAYDAGRAMWNGQGMQDGGNITGQYAVYKVALGMLAEKITGFTPSIGIPANWFAPFQNSNGGITTDKTNGVPQGSQNVETTAAVLFAINPSLLTTTTPPTGQLDFNIAGDFRDTPATGTNLVSDTPDLILSTGDYGVEFDASDWCNNIMSMWKNSGIPTYGALGNHDGDEYLSLGFFQNTTWEWTHKRNGIAFIGCNTVSENYQDADTRCQAAFNDSTIHTIIILMHEGIWHPEGTSVSSDTTIEFHNTFLKYKPKLKMVICGHTHVYGRMVPVDNILYVMNGTGGQSASTGSTAPAPFHKINGVLKCRLNTDRSITCQMVANTGEAPSPVLDTFTIQSNGLLPTDGVAVRPRTGGTVRPPGTIASREMKAESEHGRPFRVSDPKKVVGKPCKPFDCPKTVRQARKKRKWTQEDRDKQVHEETFSIDNKIIQSAAQLPEQVVRGEIRIDNENKPTGPVISQFKVEVGSLSSTADTIFVNDIKVDASVLSPNGKYWLVLLPCGTSYRNTILWHHDGDMTTLNKYSAFAKGETRNSLSDWQISRYGPTYGHAIFARLRRIQEYSDPQSIERFRMKEDIAEADFLDDSLSVAKFMQNVLAVRGKPVREYSINEVTLPTDKWFTPGQNVTIVDDTGHHPESSNIFAEIQEVSYQWSTSQADRTIGTFKINVLPVGHLNWHRAQLEDNQ